VPCTLRLGVEPLLKGFDGPAESFGTGHVNIVSSLHVYLSFLAIICLHSAQSQGTTQLLMSTRNSFIES